MHANRLAYYLRLAAAALFSAIILPPWVSGFGPAGPTASCLADSGRIDPPRQQVDCIELSEYNAAAPWGGQWQVLYWRLVEIRPLVGQPVSCWRIVHRRYLCGEQSFRGHFDAATQTATDRFSTGWDKPAIRVTAPLLIQTRSTGDPDVDDRRIWGEWYREKW